MSENSTPPSQTPLSPTGFSNDDPSSPSDTNDPPKVLIVGAGLAGLFLGCLLEQAGIPYLIFERVAEIRPLGKYYSVRREENRQD